MQHVSCESPLSAPSGSSRHFNISNSNLRKSVYPTPSSVTGKELSEVDLLVCIGDTAERFILKDECNVTKLFEESVKKDKQKDAEIEILQSDPLMHLE